jgi:RNA polymerase sigma factor (TIGR02999 family)
MSPRRADDRPADDALAELLQAWSDGDPRAAEEVMDLVYRELRRQAARQLRREQSNHTLSPTALVHEVYLRLATQRDTTWVNRTQFLALTAMLMRRILIEHARRRQAAKRAGTRVHLLLEDLVSALETSQVDVLALDAALRELAELDPQKARLVELRFFAGLNIDETAELLGVSPATVSREWRVAKAWLFRKLNPAPAATPAKEPDPSP